MNSWFQVRRLEERWWRRLCRRLASTAVPWSGFARLFRWQSQLTQLAENSWPFGRMPQKHSCCGDHEPAGAYHREGVKNDRNRRAILRACEKNLPKTVPKTVPNCSFWG